jgi:hypothetical protein
MLLIGHLRPGAHTLFPPKVLQTLHFGILVVSKALQSLTPFLSGSKFLNLESPGSFLPQNLLSEKTVKFNG